LVKAGEEQPFESLMDQQGGGEVDGVEAPERMAFDEPVDAGADLVGE